MSPRARATAKSVTTDVLIPEKLYFRIGEVSRLCQLPHGGRFHRSVPHWSAARGILSGRGNLGPRSQSPAQRARLGEQARLHAAAFSWERTVDGLLDSYRRSLVALHGPLAVRKQA